MTLKEVILIERHPLCALSETFLSTKTLSPSTIKQYRLTFKNYIAYLTKHNILYAKTSDVIKFRESRRKLGHSAQYIYVQISALKGLYHYLKQHQRTHNLPTPYRFDIMSVIKNERIKHHVRKHILTIEEARQLIVRTKKKRRLIWDYRDHAIVYLMITTGLKSVEIRKAKRSQLKKVKGQLILTITEGEFVKLTPKVESALNDYLMKRDDDNPYLFISHKQVSKDGHLSRLFFMDMFPRVLKTAGLEHTNITPHCLRHTAATLNLLSGGSIGQTKALMRHKEVKSTLVYVEYINRLKDDSEHQIEQFILKENHRVYPHQVIILE